MFSDRKRELAALNARWDQGKCEFFICWGRRRVGKTELLSEFARNKRTIFFEATDGSERDQLADLSRAIAAIDDSVLALGALESWDTALAQIADLARSEQLLVVFDEFQYLARRNRRLGSLLNRWWREQGRSLPIFLVLCGSEISFFQEEVLGYTGTTYGRRTGQLKIEPLSYLDAAKFMPSWSAVDRIRAYAVCGGMPYYLEQLDRDTSLANNINRVILARDGVLYDEARLLLYQELPKPSLYFSILRAIANGCTRSSQIADRTGFSSSMVAQALDVLQALQLVTRLVPITVKNPERTKLSSYTIADNFLRFWFHYVLAFQAELAEAETFLKQRILPTFDAFVSKPVFEEIARMHLSSVEPDLRVGPWWGRIPTGVDRKTELRELDGVGLNRHGKVAAIATCKWSRAKVDIEEIRLIDRIETQLPAASDGVRRYIYSRAGFTTALEKLASASPGRYRLVTPDLLYV